jgi:hypothetical protein
MELANHLRLTWSHFSKVGLQEILRYSAELLVTTLHSSHIMDWPLLHKITFYGRSFLLRSILRFSERLKAWMIKRFRNFTKDFLKHWTLIKGINWLKYWAEETKENFVQPLLCLPSLEFVFWTSLQWDSIPLLADLSLKWLKTRWVCKAVWCSQLIDWTRLSICATKSRS